MACSLRSASTASRRCCANNANNVNTIVPPTTTLRASIVLVNQTGGAGVMPPSTSPAIPELRKMTTYAAYHFAAARTSLNTRAPSGAEDAHKPTPPESRKPPSGIIDRVGANRMSNRLTRSSRPKSRLREKDAERSEQDGEIDERYEPDRRSERQVEDAQTIGRKSTRDQD